MTLPNNAPAVAARLGAVGRAVRAELAPALQGLAGQVAATMRVNAPKYLTLLSNTVKATRRSALEWFVGPTQDYALYVDKGRKPGKGLPRFALGLPAVEWLRRRLVNQAQAANPKYRRARKGSKREAEFEDALKTRYMAWSRHVKAHGLKAHPFVKPTADAHRDAVQAGLIAAVQRGIARAKGASA